MVKVFDTPINTNDQSIDRVLAAGLSTVLVFLDGKASPALEEAMNRLAREYAGQLLVAQVQVKDNPESVRRYQVQRTPAIVTVRSGNVVSRAENVDSRLFEQHVLYLLGKGPQPAQPPQPSSATRPSQAPYTPPPGTRTTGTATAPIHVTDATFEQQVMKSREPVLVDFWAPWCGPCRMIEPIVERMAQSMSGRLRVAKVNVDENPAVSQRFDVQGIPTMMIVKDGRVVERWTGAMPESVIRNKVAQHVA